MMTKEAKHKTSAFMAIRTACGNLFTHQEILQPFVVIAFIQLLILEILYFFPRYPLNKFFGPLVSKLDSPDFMHYPLNFQLLPKLFQNTQIPLYIFVSSFFIGAAIAVIVELNNEVKISMKKIYKSVLGSYVHLIIASALMFLVIMGLFYVVELAYTRALIIQATQGYKFWIKLFVIKGSPFFQFVISVIVTTLFAYAIPIIIIDRKNVFVAIARNLQVVFRNLFFTLGVVLIPSLLYVLILLVRINMADRYPFPEMSVLLIVVNILVLVLIDAIVYTALAMYYLLQKENS